MVQGWVTVRVTSRTPNLLFVCSVDLFGYRLSIYNDNKEKRCSEAHCFFDRC